MHYVKKKKHYLYQKKKKTYNDSTRFWAVLSVDFVIHLPIFIYYMVVIIRPIIIVEIVLIEVRASGS